jgi:isopenicillin-N epimerase
MVALDLDGLGAAYYTGNAHKWLCAPKGAAFLHVRRDRQAGLHPGTISHGYEGGFHAEFDWTGTGDPTPWLCIPALLRFMGGLLPGGWPELMATNRALALEARQLLCERFGLPPPAPASMIGSMASLPLPAAQAGSPAFRLDTDGLDAWIRKRGVDAWFHPWPLPVLRVSAQLYNSLEGYQRLADLLDEALHGE